MPDPLDPQAELEKQAAIRRLSLALMSQPQTPGLSQQGGLAGGLAQGIQQGNNWGMQGELSKAMGVETPLQKMLKLFGGGTAAPPPGSMDYGGPR